MELEKKRKKIEIRGDIEIKQDASGILITQTNYQRKVRSNDALTLPKKDMTR